jgi:hypothetical protein
MELVNCTGHKLRIYRIECTCDLGILIDGEGLEQFCRNCYTEFSPSQYIAHVQESYREFGSISKKIGIYQITYGAVDGLPAFKPNTYYIVTKEVKDALPLRIDLLTPGKPYHSSNDEIIGNIGLCV